MVKDFARPEIYHHLRPHFRRQVVIAGRIKGSVRCHQMEEYNGSTFRLVFELDSFGFEKGILFQRAIDCADMGRSSLLFRPSTLSEASYAHVNQFRRVGIRRVEEFFSSSPP